MPSDPNPKAVIFCRVSTKQQGEKWSLPKQVETAERYAEHARLTVVREPWSIVESGYKLKERKQFQAMVQYIRHNRIGHLIVLNVERLTRDFHGMVDLDDLIAEVGLSIHFTETNEVIGPESAGDKRTFWAIKVAFARQYIVDLQHKARRSIEARLDAGLYPFNAPLGYTCKANHLTPIDKEVPFVRKAFEWYATGTESLYTLSEKLYDAGLRTRKGGKVSVTTLAVLLQNPVVVGYVVWPYDDCKHTDDHQKGELIEGQHEAIIDRGLFDKVQEVIGQNGHPHPQKQVFMTYRGLMRCGACGRVMSGFYNKEKGHTYYQSNKPRGQSCPHSKTYREELVEEKFREALGRFTFPKDLYGWMREMLKASHEDKEGHFEAERRRLQGEESQLAAKLKRLFNDRLELEGMFDKATVQEKVTEIKLEQARVRSQRDRMDKDAVRYVEQGITMLDLVQDLRGTFEGAKPEQRHRLLKIIFKQVVVQDGQFRFEVNEPFTALYGMDRESSCLAPRAGLEPAT